ncbi:hypothetical protein FGO68_gene10946 [Halteria grandinella]|uniref:Uncharacterized protein n=1 Tax=Halteria grandinella TaxID=5974 RepID=A0A8J8NCT5_HALGN|nr:hypothetical protein FGO68_gene10946 [Halteria grandinella]
MFVKQENYCPPICSDPCLKLDKIAPFLNISVQVRQNSLQDNVGVIQESKQVVSKQKALKCGHGISQSFLSQRSASD